MENIVLHVYYTGAQAKAFVEEMQSGGLQAAVKAEDGCLQYDYFVPTQDTGVALLLEKWRDSAAIEKHNASENMVKLKATKAKYGLETKIERYE